jgi:hypothetical protein
MAPEGQVGEKEMKCILRFEKYFYMSQCYSGERCGPWASCLDDNRGFVEHSVTPSGERLVEITDYSFSTIKQFCLDFENLNVLCLRSGDLSCLIRPHSFYSYRKIEKKIM